MIWADKTQGYHDGLLLPSNKCSSDGRHERALPTIRLVLLSEHCVGRSKFRPVLQEVVKILFPGSVAERLLQRIVEGMSKVFDCHRRRFPLDVAHVR